jgi:hypothetical protein
MKDENITKIAIKKELYQEIERIVEQSNQFDDVPDYVNFVLQEVLFGEDAKGYSEEEEEMVKKRLRDLGYL